MQEKKHKGLKLLCHKVFLASERSISEVTCEVLLGLFGLCFSWFLGRCLDFFLFLNYFFVVFFHLKSVCSTSMGLTGIDPIIACHSATTAIASGSEVRPFNDSRFGSGFVDDVPSSDPFCWGCWVRLW